VQSVRFCSILVPSTGLNWRRDDPDLAIEHASAQRDHEVERVVARERQQRGRIIDAGGFQGFIRCAEIGHTTRTS